MSDKKRGEDTQRIDLLKQAFEAGMACAAAYEFGTYAVDFKKWSEENKDEIEELASLREQLKIEKENNVNAVKFIGDLNAQLKQQEEITQDERLLIKRIWSRAYMDTEEDHIKLIKAYASNQLKQKEQDNRELFTEREVLSMLSAFAVLYHKHHPKDVANNAADYLQDYLISQLSAKLGKV